jgi:predicted Zn-dependent protease with MMP-like domain
VIFRDQLTLAIHDPDELRHQVAITLRHEIAHHFGADEDRVRELGL